MNPADGKPASGPRTVVVGKEHVCKINTIQRHNSFPLAVLAILGTIALAAIFTAAVGVAVYLLISDERALRLEAADRMREAADNVEQYVEDRE